MARHFAMVSSTARAHIYVRMVSPVDLMLQPCTSATTVSVQVMVAMGVSTFTHTFAIKGGKEARRTREAREERTGKDKDQKDE